MIKIKGQILKSCQSFSRVYNSRKYAKAADVFHQPDALPEELNLIAKRQKLRQALRKEYVRKFTDPHSTEPILFDPLMQRYYSMHMTGTERFVPTFKNWCGYMATTILPIIFLALYLKNARAEFERQCRSGEIEYKDRMFKVVC